MKITLVGTGFVGLTSATIYAHFGNEVIGLGRDERKIELLNQGVINFYEPKLAELLNEALRAGKLSFTTDYASAIPQAELVIICVGTPSDAEGDVDLSALESSLKSMAPYLSDGTIVAIKSTVPPGTLDLAAKILADAGAPQTLHLASLPEFLKEGTAVDDTLYPDRILIGTTDDQTFHQLRELHTPFDAPIIQVSPNTAQLAKYAANNYLANRIVFINEMANIASAVGADIEELIQAIGFDKRIGNHYWYPGLGYGGSCFPKDVKGLAKIATKNNLSDNLFNKLDQLNSRRPEEILARISPKIGGFKGKKIAVLGLSFKPNTDDQRVSPALATLPYLLEQGAEIVAYDPMVTEIANKNIAENDHYTQVKTIEEAIAGADIILTLVEWPQIVGFNFVEQISSDSNHQRPVAMGTVFIDTRNQFSPNKLKTAGYNYFAVGRGC